MTVTSGFYNSVGGDRRYDATQMSNLFDGVINDGVFASVGDAFIVSAVGSMNVSVGTGRAWFNRTWTNNDATLLLPIEAAGVGLSRIDAVIIEVNTDARINSIKIKKGSPAVTPVAPTLFHGETLNQYPLCLIEIGPGVTKILQENITNKVGTSQCPFVTGILETISIDNLLLQWDSEFNDWMRDLEDILDDNVAGNLLNMINKNTITRLVTKDTGAVNSYVVDTQGVFEIVQGNQLSFIASHANSGPSTITIDGRLLTVKDVDDSGSKIDPEAGVIASGKLVRGYIDSGFFVLAPSGGGGDDWNGIEFVDHGGHTERIYITEGSGETDGRVHELDLNTMISISSVPTPNNSNSFIGGIMNRLYCGIYGDKLYELDLDTKLSISSVPIPTSDCRGIGGTMDRLYYADGLTNYIYELDPDTKLTISPGARLSSQPSGMDGIMDRLYCVTASYKKVFELDLETRLSISVTENPYYFSGIGGIMDKLFAQVAWNNINTVYEMDPDTKLAIRNAGATVNPYVRDIGGVKADKYQVNAVSYDHTIYKLTDDCIFKGGGN